MSTSKYKLAKVLQSGENLKVSKLPPVPLTLLFWWIVRKMNYEIKALQKQIKINNRAIFILFSLYIPLQKYSSYSVQQLETLHCGAIFIRLREYFVGIDYLFIIMLG